jgi:hypothetical protein
LNVHAPNEDKDNDIRNSIYEELEQVFDQFPRNHKKILVGDFNAKIGREDIFKPIIGNESPHEVNKDDGVRVVNFETSKNLIVKNTTLTRRDIHKQSWISPNGVTSNQIDNIFMDKRHSNILDVRFFRGADCETDH